MIIYLVRHGLSFANINGLVTGLPSDELTKKGFMQSIELRNWFIFANVTPEMFYVSHWERAKQTANQLFPNAQWHQDSRLGETIAGDVAELPLKNFLVDHPSFYELNTNKYPGGESHIDLNCRVLSFWNEIHSNSSKVIIIVTHSGPINCILQRVLGISMDKFPVFLPPHASVTVLESPGFGLDEKLQFRIKGFALGPFNIFPGDIY